MAPNKYKDVHEVTGRFFNVEEYDTQRSVSFLYKMRLTIIRIKVYSGGRQLYEY
ncbi:hypothetical protein [Paenibacillus glacialis]|uniref:hypothetical protein n=1 Tax=Paenibacillus glacialis TaxID=494026 RepID=UPI000ABD3B82|nr:hypothetical protein [Paenibacillus glacialis]